MNTITVYNEIQFELQLALVFRIWFANPPVSGDSGTWCLGWLVNLSRALSSTRGISCGCCWFLVDCYLCGDGIPTINTWLWMVCAFIDTLCKYTAWVMRSLRRCSQCGGGIPVGCGGSGRLLIDVGWRCCDGRESCGWGRLAALLLGDCWECACSSLRLAWWGVLFSGDRWSQRVDLAGSRWSLRRPPREIKHQRLQPQVARPAQRLQPTTTTSRPLPP
jgi:hypothetical protein